MKAVGSYHYLVWVTVFAILLPHGCAGSSSTVIPKDRNTPTSLGPVSNLGQRPENPSSSVVKEKTSDRRELAPESDLISSLAPSRSPSLYRLAIFPFWLSRGRDFAQYNYIDKFLERINKVLDASEVFVPVYSVYDLKSKYGTRLITSNIVTAYSLDRMWSKSNPAELDKNLAITAGKQLGVDAIVVCKVYSDPYSHGYEQIWLVDYRLDKVQFFLLDVKTEKLYSNESRNVTSSFKQVLKEFEHDHP